MRSEMASPAADQASAPTTAGENASFNLRRSVTLLRHRVRSGIGSDPPLTYWLATVALLTWPALSVRSWLLLTTSPAFRASDLRGFMSDVGMATLASAAAFTQRRSLRRALLGFAFVVMVVVNLVNFEHVRANGASFDIRAAYLIFDGTFARGSILGVSAMGQVALILVPPLLGLYSFHRFAGHLGRRVSRVEFVLAALACIAFEVIVRVPSDRIPWRQQNPLAENASRIWHRSVIGDFRSASERPALPPEYRHLHEQDLGGDSVFASQPPIENVLMILIEGLSRGHIFDMRDPARGPGWLPNLAEFAARHVDFTQYVSLQRQTNRAEYTVLCGDLPNILTADSEMDIYSATSSSERAECLPGFLRRHGLKTMYLQAAPITFMGKDEFLPNAGFSSVLDTKWFSNAYATSGWGVDDRAFFEHAAELILRSQKSDEPWFLTLLTVGTHHPYLIPREWQGRSKVGAFEDSLLYLDAVLKRFFSLLEESHVLDNTLVLVTGDESAGYIVDNETAEMMTQHSVPLIAAYPGDRPTRVHQRFTHSDLALSVADALGLGESSQFHGRSVFRRYDRGRRLVFGNTYLAKLGAIGPRDELLLCDPGLTTCSGFVVSKDDAFLSQLTPRGVSMDEPASLKQAVFALDRKVPTESKGRTSLMVPGTVRLRPKADPQLLSYGKYHDTEGPTRASVHLAFGVVDGVTTMHHDIASAGGAEVLFDTPSLPLLPGINIEWDYELFTREPIRQLEFRMLARNHGGKDALVEVREATVEFTNSLPTEATRGDRAPAEVVPRRFNVTLSKATTVNLLEERSLLSRLPCVKEEAGGSWVMEGCQAGLTIFGPYVPMPGDSTLRIALKMTVERGTAIAGLDIAADRGQTTIVRAEPVPLSIGQTKDLELAVRLTRDHTDLETRLHLSDVADFKATITEAELHVSP
jgi:hypothetical protein